MKGDPRNPADFTDRYVDDSPDPDPDAAELARLLADVENLHVTLFSPPPC